MFHELLIPIVAIGLLIGGLIGQGFEMRNIRKSITRDEDLGSLKIFTDKRNYKWYVMIGGGLFLWYITGGWPQ
jgi:hypothetical protein